MNKTHQPEPRGDGTHCVLGYLRCEWRGPLRGERSATASGSKERLFLGGKVGADGVSQGGGREVTGGLRGHVKMRNENGDVVVSCVRWRGFYHSISCAGAEQRHAASRRVNYDARATTRA